MTEDNNNNFKRRTSDVQGLEHERLLTLEQRYNHMDSRVTATAEDMASVKASVDNIASTLDKVADKVNAPDRTNWVGLLGALISTVIVMGAGVDLIVSPMERTLLHQNVQIEKLEDTVTLLRERTAEAAISRKAVGDYAEETRGRIDDFLQKSR